MGVIQTKSGYTIEILPKIYSTGGKDYEEAETRKIFLKMLRTLRDSPFKKLDLSSIQSGHFPLLEIFILMFTEELFLLVHRGLKSAYIPHEENAKFLKGRLLMKEHIKYNFIHKERFFVAFDEFSPDRPANRLLKTTVEFLLKKSTSNHNQRRLRQLLYYFDEVHFSKNIDKDFQKIKQDRLLKDYELLLQWCRIFLKRDSFTNFVGDDVAFAILFPMEKIFESYVAHEIKSQVNQNNNNWGVSTQDTGHHLIEGRMEGDTFKTDTKFNLRPDIVMKKGKEETIILDTKWKLLQNDNSKNYGIKQSDMYQMYAYGKKYSKEDGKDIKVEQMYLIYPMNENFKDKTKETKDLIFGACHNIANYIYETNLRLDILLWDFNIENQVQ